VDRARNRSGFIALSGQATGINPKNVILAVTFTAISTENGSNRNRSPLRRFWSPASDEEKL
jgi:hypothetical protein